MSAFRSRFGYGDQTLVLDTSQRPWDVGDMVLGDFDVSGAGVPAGFVLREQELYHLRLRFWEYDWPGVRAMARYAMRGRPVDWSPEDDDEGFSVYLHSPLPDPQGGEVVRPQRDPEFERVMFLDITVRRVTGDFDRRFFRDGVLVLFMREAPGPVTSTRASGATEVDKHGTLQAVGENILRTNWRINPVSGKLEPFGPLEPERTNVLHGSNLTNGTSDDWTGEADFTVTEVASIFDGQSAWRHENGGTAGSRQRSQIRGTLGATPETASTILENEDAELSHIGIFDNTVADWVVRGVYDWNAGTFTVLNSGAGTDVSVRPEVLREIGPNGGKVVRLEVTGTATNPGNSRRTIVYPSGITTNVETAIIHHVQHEVGTSASSPIVTPTGAPATRAVDILSRAAPPAGMTLAGYHSFIARGTEIVVGGRYFQVGTGDDTNRVFQTRTTSSGLVPQVRLGAGGTNAFVSATIAPARDDFVEHVPVLEYEGTQARVRLVQAINGTLSGSSAWSAYIDATALIESGWSADELYVNSRESGINAGAQEARKIGFFERDVVEAPLSGDDPRLLHALRELARRRVHPRVL